MPRDCLGEFYCTLLPRYQRHDHSTDKTIIDLFNTRLSNADMSKIGNLYVVQLIQNKQ